MAPRRSTATAGNVITMPEQPVFEERDTEVRGTVYRFRELSAVQYDECLKMATKADEDIDMVLLLRLMLVKSLVEPKLSAVQISELPYKVTRQLSTVVNRMHFADDDE